MTLIGLYVLTWVFWLCKVSFTLVLCINVINDQQRSRDASNKGNNKCQVTMADQEGPFFEAGKITIQFSSIKI